MENLKDGLKEGGTTSGEILGETRQLAFSCLNFGGMVVWKHQYVVQSQRNAHESWVVRVQQQTTKKKYHTVKKYKT